MFNRVIQLGARYRYGVPAGSLFVANSGTAAISIAEADGYITIAANANYNAGKYRYTITDTDGDIIEGGNFQLLPSLAAGDGRTRNQIILDAIDAVLEGRASQNQLSVSVGDKSIRYLDHSELLNLRSHYQEMVDDEMAALQGINRQSYVTRFV